MAGVAKKSPQAHQNRAGTDGSAVGPLGLAFKSCLLCPESDRAVDARAEIHVNSSRHAARVAPEILHRTEAPRAALQGCGERMCGAMEADPFEQPYWNLDQYLIWLASRDPAAVLRATDRPNSDANPPSGWHAHRESNVDRQKVETEGVRAIKGGHIKARVELNGKWFMSDDPEWRKWFTPDEEFADWAIDFEDEPTFAALLVRSTKDGRREKVRPRFNPQSIRERYRTPTPSNVCYRPDELGADRFIAYEDVLNWRAECISLRGSLPIDKAGLRAEKTIRDICMNTPEKLTMLGILNTDAELKPVTPQAWQALSISPLYNRATKGDGGQVIWTDLCFDRKQLVAAFVTGDGKGPPTPTPVAQPTQPAGRRGTAPKADWSAIEEAFRCEVAERGMPDETNVDGWQRQADVERWLSNILIRERVGVSEATLRRHAKGFLSRARGGS